MHYNVTQNGALENMQINMQIIHEHILLLMQIKA